MSWSSSRQLFFGSIFVFVIILISAVPAYFIFFDKPQTCFDGKQSSNELGIDCGGVCQRACSQEVIDLPIVLWSRAFPINNNSYNLVAYVQNPNVYYISRPVKYSFRVYDSENVLIGLRNGYTNIPSVKSFPVFEQALDTNQRVPSKILFSFDEVIEWSKYDSFSSELLVTEPMLINATTTPRIDAKISNTTLNRFENTEVVVVVYGANDNAIAVSRTFVPAIESRSEIPVVFTWQNPFNENVTKIEIIPKIQFKF